MAPPDSAATLDGAVRWATARLAAAGIEGPGRDARLLVAAALGATQTELILHPERRLTDLERRRVDETVARRCRHEPVSRILGEREFYGRTFKITPDTLDPRPDSETLIEAVLEVVGSEGRKDHPLRILDIGTGTGCLVATLLCELPAAVGVGIDVSPGALEVARCNSQQLGVADRAEFRLQAAAEVCDTFDILVSNPPYIRSSEIAGLAEDVKGFDPAMALDGGFDGLVVYRQIATRLPSVLPAGWAFFEVGDGQADELQHLLKTALMQRIQTSRAWRDLGGRERCVAVELH